MRPVTWMRPSMTGSDAFVDTGVFIAAARKPDSLHEKGKELITELERQNVRVHISDMILAETVTFILRKDGDVRAMDVLKVVETGTTVHFVDRPVLDDAKDGYPGYAGSRERHPLGFAECLPTAGILECL